MTIASLAASPEIFLITDTVGAAARPLVNVIDVASDVTVYGEVLIAPMLIALVGGQGQLCGLGQNVDPQLSGSPVTVELATTSIPTAPPTRSAVMRAPLAGSTS